MARQRTTGSGDRASSSPPSRTAAAASARAAEAAAKINYRGAGTIEVLVEDDEFHFIEMNTRLQVEHPISEMISGIDLVREQIKIAAGEPITLTQADIVLSGHAIECRVVAEHPDTFVPSPGKVTEYRAGRPRG